MVLQISSNVLFGQCALTVFKERAKMVREVKGKANGQMSILAIEWTLGRKKDPQEFWTSSDRKSIGDFFSVKSI